MTRRLLLSYLTVTLIVLVVLQVPLGVFYGQRERERIEANLGNDAEVIATLYEDALEQGRALDPRPAEDYSTRTGVRVVVVDRQGISQIDTEQRVGRDFSTRPEIATALTGVRASGTRGSETLATNLLYVAVPAASGGVVHGAVRLTLDTSDVTARVQRFWWALAGVGGVVMATVALVGWAIARSVTRPIRALQADAARYATGDLTGAHPDMPGPPEVRQLAGSLATMAQQLDDLLRAQRAFVADASHQLRTPLTALRLRLENLEARLDGAPAEELERAIEETQRLGDLVADLLRLVRADEHPEPVPVDLDRICRERVELWSAVAEQRRMSLRYEHETGGPAPAIAVSGGVEQILDNLLDNALHASPDGGTITLALSARPHGWAVSVLDEGPGLSDDELRQAPRRFWRGTTARPGTGLGLAIVDSLVTASGGRLELARRPTGGLVATVSLASADQS